MKKAILITLAVLGILALAGGLLVAGMLIGRGTGWVGTLFHPNYVTNGYTAGPGIMNGYYSTNGYSMMGRGNGVGPGMMGRGNGYGMMGNGYGMMNGYGTTTSNVTPLTLDQAYQAATKYLSALNNSDLKIAEVIVFNNNAYVRVIEQSTGIGAFELLVDPATQVAYPEMGPNMMWNLKYGGLNHQQMIDSGIMGGMMGANGMMQGYANGTVPQNVSPDMPVSSDQALKDAQAYLDKALPGTVTAGDADPFYGYYTIDFLRDGKISGMLSVNGASGQVFLHTWHGTFTASKDY